MAFTEKLKKEIEAATAPSLTDIQEGTEGQATQAALDFEKALKIKPNVVSAPILPGPPPEGVTRPSGAPGQENPQMVSTQAGPMSLKDIEGATFQGAPEPPQPAVAAPPPPAAAAPPAEPPPAAPTELPPGPPDMAGSVPVKPAVPPEPSFGEKLGAMAKKFGVPLLHLLQAGAYGYTGNPKETVLEKIQAQKAKMKETEAGRAYEQAAKQQDRDFAIKLAAIQQEYQRTGDERTAQQAMERLKIEQQGALQRTQIMAQSGPGGSSNSFQADADKLLK
jgi:hypothetical protein